jgi:hypothetical protein
MLEGTDHRGRVLGGTTETCHSYAEVRSSSDWFELSAQCRHGDHVGLGRHCGQRLQSFGSRQAQTKLKSLIKTSEITGQQRPR